MDENQLLINRLKEYGKSRMYPFHMPGHKRMQKECGFPNPFSVDITEIEGFDNLHHPEGILRESMEWASGVYGSDRTWYLVNGSSCGILGAISAVSSGLSRGKKILISRNCHKAVYNGVYLNHMEAVYVYPQFIPELGIQGGILPEDVEKALEKDPDIGAVLLVSPTYDGVVSDIRKISEIVHKRGIPLIVDEAHGAHFAYGPEFPVSALDLGGDVVIQSVHKTLPSLTQTALLHFKRNKDQGGPFIDEGRLERFLQIYQSSSPSYILMASIENAVFQMEQEKMTRGQPGNRLDAYRERLKNLREGLSRMENLHLGGGFLGEELKGQNGVYDLDVTKILISSRNTGMTGPWLDDILRKKYSLEMELRGADYVLGITTCFDSDEGFRRLKEGAEEIDRLLQKNKNDHPDGFTTLPEARVRCSFKDALNGSSVRLPLLGAQGRISCEFIYVYPPGIPILAPGEEITDSVLQMILNYKEKGLPVQGPEDHSLEFLKVMDR